ncbi:MAG: hypothetical protein M9894_18615 [Planctomycetes bacterium]|nr:hypothetical protein [Planctomycetota bacterium]
MSNGLKGDPRLARILRLGRDAGGARWYLAGRPVQCGARLELRLEAEWMRVRFELEGSPEVTSGWGWPVLFLDTPGPSLRVPLGREQLEAIELRWPSSTRRRSHGEEG